MNFYLGTQGWSYKDWVGPFYPPGTAAGDYLALYATVFNAVELDTTFYGTPAPGRVARWNGETPDDFCFTAKLPRSITHDRHLVDAREELEEFLHAVEPLGDKLGALLIQLPPDFTVDEQAALEDFLKLLPRSMRFAAEFRHRSWLRDETFDVLRRYGVAWTAIDLSYMPKRLETTADFTYVRWLGNRSQITRMNEVQIDRSSDLDRWAEQLENVARDVERVYGFVNNHYSGHSPADVRHLRRRLGMPDPMPTDDAPQQRHLL